MELEPERISISFCTTCMNRLHQLKKTLPKNIEDNMDYPEANFILIDYSSTDGLSSWIKKNMIEHLLSGKLVYYRYDDALKFHPSHSRNLAFKAATGEVICNLDADNYTGPKFSQYINSHFGISKNIFLTTIDYLATKKNYKLPTDVLGRICVRKEDFLQIQGFDERMVGYAFEDHDFTNRLEQAGLNRVLIEGNEFMNFIPHENSERSSFNTLNRKVSMFCICYKKPWESILLMFFENETAIRGTLVNNTIINAENERYAFTNRRYIFQQTLKETQWLHGTWSYENSRKIVIKFTTGQIRIFNITKNKIMDQVDGSQFFFIKNKFIINRIVFFYLTVFNRMIMEQNKKEKVIVTNKGCFGEGELSKLTLV